MSQGPSFLFIDLRHVVTDDLDLHANAMRLSDLMADGSNVDLLLS